MDATSLKKLLQRLSSMGLETLEAMLPQTRTSTADTLRKLCLALLQLKGEASAIALAEEIIHEYQEAEAEERVQFFRFLNDELGADTGQLNAAMKLYQDAPEQLQLLRLSAACESQRLDLFRTLNSSPGGTQALIHFREDLQRLLPKADPTGELLDQELQYLFKAWFNRGFLELRQIDWQTPAFILEKLIQYESVHEIKGWPDLRRRLEADRRCFGFFHPALPNEPLIFVEAALTHGLSNNIHALLEQHSPELDADADTAVFYSINNCLDGLRGISFGNFLIKQVIEQLASEASDIKNYATLSPVPGFMRWLKNSAPLPGFLTDPQRSAVQQWLPMHPAPDMLAGNQELQSGLIRLCAHYLINEKSREKPLDPVARFHLGNGARLERINWLADTSGNGLKQSAGLMVNYVYDRKTLARNHEAYERQHEVASAAQIRKLLG